VEQLPKGHLLQVTIEQDNVSVQAKIQRDKARVLLLAPWWPEARWWNTLMTLTTDMVRVHMTDENVQVNQGQDPRRWPGACAVVALVDASKTR
jgi:hypothetical protein